MIFKVEIQGDYDGDYTNMTIRAAKFEGSVEDMEAAFGFLFMVQPYLVKCAKKAIKELEE